MRIAVDATPVLGAPTGVGTFVRGALGGLAQRDGVSLVAYGLTGQRRARAMLVAAVPGSVEVGRTFPAAVALSEWGRGHRLPAVEWLAGGRVDVVHGTNFVVPPSRRGAARVVTVHDLAAVKFPELCSVAARRYPELVRRAADEGAWIHTPSNFVAEEVSEWLGVDRVRAVHHGIDPAPAPTAPSASSASSASGSSTVIPSTILAVGTIEPRKDLPLLVRAFDRIADGRPTLRLVIAGADGWGAEALTEAISAARHSGRIERSGYVDAKARRRLMEEAGVFAFPWIYEGFGLPPLEAMAAGVPVVATEAGAVGEVVGDAALLVPVGDETAMAEALAAVVDDVGLAAALRVRGRYRAATFTWEACAEGLISLYGEAGGAGAAGGGGEAQCE